MDVAVKVEAVGRGPEIDAASGAYARHAVVAGRIRVGGRNCVHGSDEQQTNQTDEQKATDGAKP
jgi:hypothetical protein